LIRVVNLVIGRLSTVNFYDLRVWQRMTLKVILVILIWVFWELIFFMEGQEEGMGEGRIRHQYVMCYQI